MLHETRQHPAPPLVHDYLPPRRLLWQSPGAQCHIDQAPPPNAQPSVTPYPVFARLDAREHPQPGFLIDFGRQLHGGVRLVSQDCSDRRPRRLRLRLGESVGEAMGEPTNDHSIQDTEMLMPWKGEALHGFSGFRFLRVDLLEPGAWVDFREISALSVHSGLPRRGQFRSSDPLLDEIWECAAHTVYLNMQNYLWDGIKRDRLVWAGDLHPEICVINAAYGEVEVVPRSLDLVRDETPLPRYMNGISSYSLWWILSHHEWFRHHGRRDYLAEQRDYLVDLTRQLEECIEPDGSENLPELRFLDWPSSPDPAAIHCGLQALMTLAFARAAELFEALGEKAQAQRCRQARARLLEHRPPLGENKQAAALAALAGHHDADTVNRDILAQNPLQGISSFYGFYVLQARAAAGDHAGALELLRRYWGGMIQLGATSFWEDFDLRWMENAARIDELTPEGKIDVHAAYGGYCFEGLRKSLCHGWAGGPCAWLSQQVLGVEPLEPGCTRLRVRPRLGDLEWAEGAYPTPHGEIRLRHALDDAGRVQSDIEAPPGVQVELETPEPQSTPQTLSTPPV